MAFLPPDIGWLINQSNQEMAHAKTESPPAERVGSGSPIEGGVFVGKAPLGLTTHHQVPIPIVAVQSYLVPECTCVWLLHPTLLC